MEELADAAAAAKPEKVRSIYPSEEDYALYKTLLSNLMYHRDLSSVQTFIRGATWIFGKSVEQDEKTEDIFKQINHFRDIEIETEEQEKKVQKEYDEMLEDYLYEITQEPADAIEKDMLTMVKRLSFLYEDFTSIISRLLPVILRIKKTELFE